MTTESAVATALLPAAAALAVLALADPKRRRTRGELPIPPSLRRSAIAVLLVVTVVVGFSGVAPLLIFVAAVSSIGWAISVSFASVDARRLVFLETGARGAEQRVRAAMSWSASWIEWLRSEGPLRPGLSRRAATLLAGTGPSGLFRAGALAAMVIAIAFAGLAWNAAAGADRDARRAGLLQGISLLNATTSDVRPALTCVDAVLTSLNPGQVLADLERGGPLTIPYRTPSEKDSGDESLQRCLLSNGVDTIAVEPTELRTMTRFVLDPASARALESAVHSVLDRYEDFASAASVATGADPVVCRLSARLPPDTRALLDLMGRNLRRPELRGLIRRVPNLLRWSGEDGAPSCSGFATA